MRFEGSLPPLASFLEDEQHHEQQRKKKGEDPLQLSHRSTRTGLLNSDVDCQFS